MAEIIRTALMGTLLPRLSRVHHRRRIGVFAGPPGIGKTTTVRAFAAEHAGAVMLVTVPPGAKAGIRSTAALQAVLPALYDFMPSGFRSSSPTGYVELRNRLYGLLYDWYRGHLGTALTIVFDEAQNLSEDAIETLRYLNDEGAGFAPFPVGLVFVGNNTFQLQSDIAGHSVLTAAVRDRALFTDVFAYDDVTDDDLSLFLELKGIVDPEAVRLVLRRFRTGRVDRSYRRVADLCDELAEEARDTPITATTFKAVMGLD